MKSSLERFLKKTVLKLVDCSISTMGVDGRTLMVVSHLFLSENKKIIDQKSLEKHDLSVKTNQSSLSRFV